MNNAETMPIFYFTKILNKDNELIFFPGVDEKLFAEILTLQELNVTEDRRRNHALAPAAVRMHQTANSAPGNAVSG